MLDARLAQELQFEDQEVAPGDDASATAKSKRKRKHGDGKSSTKKRPGASKQPVEHAADHGAVRLFRRISHGTPCQLDVVNRPGQPATKAPPRRTVPSSDSDEEDKLLSVVVDAAHIYSTAEEAAKRAAANVSTAELVGAMSCEKSAHHDDFLLADRIE